MTQASFFSIVFDVQTSRFLNGFVNRFKNKLKPTFPNMALTAVYMGVCGWGACACVRVCVSFHSHMCKLTHFTSVCAFVHLCACELIVIQIQ